MDASRLTKIRSFAGLSEAELRSVAARAVEESVAPGTILIREGDFAWDLIAVLVRLTHWDVHYMRRTAPSALDAIRALSRERTPSAA